jgi:hypothetical protein
MATATSTEIASSRFGKFALKTTPTTQPKTEAPQLPPYDPTIVPDVGTEFVLTETASAAVARKIAQHPELWSVDRQNFNQLADALELDGSVAVTYTLDPTLVGRYQPNTFGGTRMWRKARSTLYGPHLLDIDQVSSQPAHLLQLAQNTLSTRPDLYDWLAEFVADKAAYAKTLGVSTPLAKSFVLKVCVFGQEPGNWLTTAQDENLNATLTEQMVSVAETACDLRGALLSLKPWGSALDKMLTSLAAASAAKKGREASGTAKLAHFLQHRERIETDLLLAVFKQHRIPMAIYCFDGFCVAKRHSAAVHTILDRYNQSSFVRWSVKEWDSPLTFEQLDKPFNMTEWRTKTDYPSQKAYFEQTHAVVLDTNRLARRLGNEWVQWSAEGSKAVGYANLKTQTIGKDGKKECVSFVGRWLRDDTRLTFDRMDFYPPPLRVPPGSLNTWLPAEISNLPLTDYHLFDPATDPVLRHIHYFSGCDPAMTEFITKTIAFKVQKPGAKTLTAVLNVGKQGGGKTEFLLRLSNAFWGSKQVLNTTQVEDLCGSFSLLANKICVIYDEPTSRDTHQSAEQLKFLITTRSTEIGAKGVQKTRQQTPCLLFLCSNNVGGKPIQTDDGDRRWVVTRSVVPPCSCPDDRKSRCRTVTGKGGCKTYFDHLYGRCMSYGDSDNVPHPESPAYMRRLFEYLNTMDLTDFDPCDIPRSAYHEELIRDSKGVVERFYDELCYAHHHNDNVLGFADASGGGVTEQTTLPFGEPVGAAWLYSLFEKYVANSKTVAKDAPVMTRGAFWRKFRQQYVGEGVEAVAQVRERGLLYAERSKTAIIFHSLPDTKIYD